MRWGNKPTDGGHLILSEDEKSELISSEPAAEQYIRRYMSGGDLLDNRIRYCLWLRDADPASLRRLPRVMERINRVRESRLASRAPSTRAYAAYPTLFRQIAQPDTDYLAIPEVSSERREYVPIAFVSSDVICSNKIQFVPDATLFHFGVLSSRMHMAWMRLVCGLLESRYSYSNSLVYNNFPWPQEVTDAQRQRVEDAAQGVLDARAEFPDATLADLYDPNSMPQALRRAHTTLDRAVDACYRRNRFDNERQRLEYLFNLYEQLIAPLAAGAPRQRRRRRAFRRPPILDKLWTSLGACGDSPAASCACPHVRQMFSPARLA
jgi:hypothetical protein